MNDRIYDLNDVLKSLPAQATLNGLSVLCADASGALQKSGASLLARQSTPVSDINDVITEGVFSPSTGALNAPPLLGIANSSDQIIFFGRSAYGIQIYIPLHVCSKKKVFIRALIAGAWSSWGYMEVIVPT